MSRVFASVHVRDIAAKQVVAAIDERMKRQGYERVAEPSFDEPVVARVFVIAQGRWTSMTVEGLDESETWAEALSKALGCLALASFHWDGESTTNLALFDRGKRLGELGLPADARRIDQRRIALPLGKLSCLVGDGARSDGLELRIPLEQHADDDREEVVYVSQEDGAHAFRRAFGIEAIHLEVDDEPGDGRILAYRPKATSAAGKRAREEQEQIVGERRAAYDARLYAVGWLAFDAKPAAIARILAATARPLAESFAPHLGPHVLEAWSVDHTKDYRREKIAAPAAGDAAWDAYAALLRDGVMIDLQRPERLLASVCAVHHEGALAVTWSFRGLKDEARRLAMSGRMHDIVLRAVEGKACFGALIAAQSRPLVLEQRALAYEYFRGRSANALVPSWFRTHARAPGWRELVPGALRGKPPSGFAMRRVKSGTLLLSKQNDPWAVTPAAMDALEVYLASSIGGSP